LTCPGMSRLSTAKCIVLLTFDFDAESAEVRKTPDLPVKVSKGQYGPRVGIRRVLEFLDKHGIKATFFVPGWTADHYSDQTREIFRRGHEVAAHGYLHENFSEMTGTEEWKAIRKSVDSLNRALGVRPTGFRAPYWDWSKRTLHYLCKVGFKYDSSLMSDDKPFQIGDEKAGQMYELPVESFLDDWPLFEIEHQSPGNVLDSWRREFKATYEMNVGYFMLTMHPECIGRASRISMLDQLVNEILQRQSVVFARCDQLVEHLQKRPQHDRD
jgi:peptidoglycan/xylan/chitin deacetylase (PgdA/CDA1 family)